MVKVLWRTKWIQTGRKLKKRNPVVRLRLQTTIIQQILRKGCDWIKLAYNRDQGQDAVNIITVRPFLKNVGKFLRSPATVSFSVAPLHRDGTRILKLLSIICVPNDALLIWGKYFGGKKKRNDGRVAVWEKDCNGTGCIQTPTT